MSRIDGLDVVLKNIDKLKQDVINEMNERVAISGAIAHTHIKQQAALTDHSYADLAAAKFPYSVKYPANTGVHDDDSQVHIQSGELHRNIELVSDIGQVKSTVEVGVSPDKVDYIQAVLFGAPKARPRPFIQHGWQNAQESIKSVMDGNK